jgi:CelD/BcsL family acetyltransferase involved in cellulose biosynthesis
LVDVRCFGSLAEVAYLRDEINALNRNAERPDPFSTFEFFENYLLHDEHAPDPDRSSIWFLTAFEEGRLIGYLPLRLVQQRIAGIRAPTLGFLVVHDTDRPHIVARPEQEHVVARLFWAHIAARASEWAQFDLHQQDERAATAWPIASIGRHIWSRDWESPENCTIPIRWRTLYEYQRSLTKKFRSNLSRQLRTLFGAGDVSVFESSDPNVTPHLFDVCRSIEEHSWKSRANASIGRSSKRIDFFNGLMDARQPMRISILVLLLNGIPIAGLVCGAFMGGLYALHIVYDERLRRLGPGSAILLLGVRHAIDGGYTTFNLLSGYGYFKSRWLAVVTATRTVQLYRRGSASYWRRRIGDAKRAAFAHGKHVIGPRFNPARRAVVDAAEFESDFTHGAAELADITRRVVRAVDAIRDHGGTITTNADLQDALNVRMLTGGRGQAPIARKNGFAHGIGDVSGS